MRTAKQLYPTEHVIYTCEFESCFDCHGALQDWHYLSSQKTVQTLTQTLAISHQAKRCANSDCTGHGAVFKSVAWQQIAPEYSTYGYDVIAQIGLKRQQRQKPFSQIHHDLIKGVVISESHVRHLYYNTYLPLLACHEI